MALLAAALEDGRDVLREGHLRWRAAVGEALLASGGSDRRGGNEDGGERLHRNLLGGRDDERAGSPDLRFAADRYATHHEHGLTQPAA